MPNKDRIDFRQVLSNIRAINLWHLTIIIILAEIVTAVMNTIMGILWWGSISYDLLMIGVVDAFVAAVVVGIIILYFVDRSHEVNNKYRELVENANTVILRMDPQGRVTYFNEFAERFFGYSKEEITGKSVIGTIVPERESTGRDLAYMIRDLCSHAQKYHTNINENMRKDGGRIWISWTNRPMYDRKGGLREILCIGTDITELRQKDEQLRLYSRQLESAVAEKTAELSATVWNLQSEILARKTVELALRESEERFREIFEQVEDALLIVSADTQRIIEVNPAAVCLYRYTEQELLSGGLSLLLPQPQEQLLRDALRSLPPHEVLRFSDITTLNRNAELLHVEIRCMAIQMRNSTFLFCVFRNITDRIGLEQEKKLLQARLIQMDKMKSLGMLVSGIAHEINNPTHYIMANAQIISDAWKDAGRVLSEHYRGQGDFSLGGVPFSEMRYVMPQLLTGLTEGAARIEKIVESLKDFSKQDSSALDRPVDANEVVTSATAILSSQIRKYTNSFQLTKGKDLPPVKGSKQRLEQVVINLIMNALQSLRDNTAAVIVSTGLDSETESILIEVRDEGIGMPQEVLSQITEPFYTTRINEGGTGLGLPISLAIIEDHQGSLTFVSEPGAGTTATISLPLFQRTIKRNDHETASAS